MRTRDELVAAGLLRPGNHRELDKPLPVMRVQDDRPATQSNRFGRDAQGKPFVFKRRGRP